MLALLQSFFAATACCSCEKNGLKLNKYDHIFFISLLSISVGLCALEYAVALVTILVIIPVVHL